MACRLLAVLAVALGAMILIAGNADSETACAETTVRDRLAAMLDEFHKPEVRAKMDAAKKDLEEDGDFDDEEQGKYFILAALWHDIDINLHASAKAACEVMMKHDAMIKSVLGV
jgi:hypothetical protein